MWENLKPIQLHKIQVVNYPESKIFKEEFEKKQIVLHHTVGSSIDGTISSWKDNKDNIGTCIIIDREGIPWQIFSSKFYNYHLAAGNHDLDKHSIGIEIDSWGWLIPGDNTVKQFGNPAKFIKTAVGKYYTYYGNSVVTPMQEYPEGFRGYYYYEKYTNAQIQTIGELLLYWKKKYNIPLTYHPEMWDVSQDALGGTPGIWTHVSYRKATEKQDCHPDPSLISLLQYLSSIG